MTKWGKLWREIMEVDLEKAEGPQEDFSPEAPAPQNPHNPQNLPEGPSPPSDQPSSEEPLQGLSIGSIISYHIPGEDEQGPCLVGRIDRNWGMLQVCTPNGWTWINPCVVIKVDQEAGE